MRTRTAMQRFYSLVSMRMRTRTVMQRLYSLVSLSVTTLFIFCFMASLTNLAQKSSLVPSLLHVQVYGVDGSHTQHSHKDKAKLALNITADLRSLFSWNTKQIFVFVAAEYVTSSNAVNQISLWDCIVTEKEQAKFHVYTSNKYSFLDQVSNMWERPFNLTVSWSVLPVTGFMISNKKTFEVFHLLPGTIHNE